MRRLILLPLLLCACTQGLPGPATPGPGATEEIIVTPLAPPGEAPPPATAETPAEPDTPPAEPALEPDAAEPEATTASEEAADVAATTEEEAESLAPGAEAAPAPPLSPEAKACQRRSGTWAKTPSGGNVCVRNTRDGGKQCTRESQCEGLCLARSGTCAPITPVFGCNDILQDDGRRVTLCLD